MNKKELYNRAFEKYGLHAQENVLVEELSELIKAVMKFRRYESIECNEHIMEEIADVEIMLEQMKHFQGKGFVLAVEEYKKKKLRRLANVLGGVYDGGN